jgi:DNA polymerase-3 subunit beta
VAGKTSTLPILGNVLIQVDQGNINLTTTNLELVVQGVVRGKTEENGSTTVSTRVLSEYINLLSPDEVVTLEQKGDMLEMNTPSVSTTIQTLPAADFPVIPEFSGGISMVINTEILRHGLTRVLFAVSTDETRPEITGVLFHATNSSLTLVSTDSYRLAECVLPLIEPLSSEVVKIIPWRTLQEVVRGINMGENVNIIYGETQVKFEGEDGTIISRLIEGQYPQYQPIIPTSQRAQCSVDAVTITRAVKQASLFCKPGVNDVRLAINKSKLVVTATHGGVGDHQAQLDVESHGEACGALFNYRFLLEGISAVGTPVVNIKLTGEVSPALITAEQEDGYKYVIMPIQQ